MPRRNCLNRPVSSHRTTAKCSGAKLGIGGKRHRDIRRRACRPGRSVGGVDQADDVTGEGLVDGLAFLAEHRVGVLGGERLAGARRGSTTMPRSNRPEHTRTNAIRSRCAGSMLACTLKTNPENGASSGPARRRRRRRGRRRRRQVDARRRAARRTPKLVSAEPNNTGVDSPARNDGTSTSAPIAVEQRRVPRRRRRPGGPFSSAGASASTTLLGRSLAPPGPPRDAGVLPGAPVDHARGSRRRCRPAR